jgi:hypothetical protein
MRDKITYDAPLISSLIYDGPNSTYVDYSYLRQSKVSPCRLTLTYVGRCWAVVDYVNLQGLSLGHHRFSETLSTHVHPLLHTIQPSAPTLATAVAHPPGAATAACPLTAHLPPPRPTARRCRWPACHCRPFF